VLEEKNSPIILIIVVVLIIWGLYKIVSPKWTLMICDEVMENGLECYSFASIHENDFGTKEMCLEIGTSLTKNNAYPVFECGRKCKHDGIFMVCDEICDKLGRCH